MARYLGLAESLNHRAAAASIVAEWTEPLLASGAPLYASRAEGSRLWDLDGNEYVDYLMSYGAVILGYADEVITESVCHQLRLGSIFSIDTPLRYELAQAVKEWFPQAEQVAVFRTGSEATQAAVRLARLATGRSIVLHCGYHGWYDWCSHSEGVPRSTRGSLKDFRYNDLDRLADLFAAHKDGVAAVILQPGGDHKKPVPGFLEGVRQLCTDEGSVLVFDEIRTGLRMSFGGAQSFFGVHPDLTAIGKGLGNGVPISAVLGSRSIMAFLPQAQADGTYHRDAIGLAAAIATLRELRKRDTIGHMWNLGDLLIAGILEIAERYPRVGLRCKGYPPMPRVVVGEGQDDAMAIKQAFYENMFLRGVMLPPNHHLFLAGSHTETDVQATLEAIEGTCRVLVSRG